MGADVTGTAASAGPRRVGAPVGLLVGFFLAIPIVNTFFKSHHTSNIIHHEQELENWNTGMEKNQSNIPVQILGNK